MAKMKITSTEKDISINNKYKDIVVYILIPIMLLSEIELDRLEYILNLYFNNNLNLLSITI